ncbi:hypothetical protein pneo_cds_851 [Pandoravirus neocaledonia]|uniref:Uncharacterized protein n=1 Tax=Pandoravirus neocaledonia TaxID=2107708 RepID=A0A2U7UDB1_9VIRU|nr:hypothetical protein pneo_cds_851 [Pandoravirus neocaledonia]AVK76458.1 hypothetical protein pneo_cds_851 [Pandoravirus neocaledonia]
MGKRCTSPRQTEDTPRLVSFGARGTASDKRDPKRRAFLQQSCTWRLNLDQWQLPWRKERAKKERSDQKMGNRQCKAPFDVRANMTLYHQHARDTARRQKACDSDDDRDDASRFKRALFQLQFGREMNDQDNDDAKLVWLIVTGGRVPIIVTPTTPTLREVEWAIIPNALNAVDDDAYEFPVVSVVVLAKAGDSPIKERMRADEFYESIKDGDRIAWRLDRIGCCFCRCAC